MKIRLFITGAACVTVAVMMTGCASVMRSTPSAGLVINANMDRNDYEVLGNTSGKSKVSYFFFGAVQIVDEDKLRILGFSTFEDQFAFVNRPGIVTAMDRAYYKALAATPDADAVAPKAFIMTTTGIPFIWGTQEVTYTGKAIKYKVHN
jgi:hypothetical protein